MEATIVPSPACNLPLRPLEVFFEVGSENSSPSPSNPSPTSQQETQSSTGNYSDHDMLLKQKETKESTSNTCYVLPISEHEAQMSLWPNALHGTEPSAGYASRDEMMLLRASSEEMLLRAREAPPRVHGRNTMDPIGDVGGLRSSYHAWPRPSLRARRQRRSSAPGRFVGRL